jgi:serine/threonine-protein kinase
LDVLVSAHQRGIVHRDLKPANLFVRESGELKVLDFGVARLRDTSLDALTLQNGALLGTPGFMAPEQALGANDIDARSDLWSVGATLFTMLSGKLVHEGENSRQVAIRAATQPARSLAAVAPTVPPSVVRAVAKALMFQRVDRWQSAASMRDYVHGVHLRLYGDFSLDRVATLVVVSQRRIDSLPTEPSPVALLTVPPSQALTSALAQPDGDSTGPTAASRPAPARSSRAYRSLSALGLGLAALFLFEVYVAIPGGDVPGSVAEPTKAGSVRVQVSTSLPVPSELDCLTWQVLRAGHTHPLRTGFLELKGPEQLPVDFTAISTRDTRGTVQIEIVGRSGGELGAVRARQRLAVEVLNGQARKFEVHLGP